jgi:hypothetical protein
MAFSGDTTLPEFVIQEIIDMIKAFAARQQFGVWNVIERVFASRTHILAQTSVVFLFREETGEIMLREMGLHDPPHRVLGVDFRYCGNPDCDCRPFATIFKKKKKSKVRQYCRRCGYTSPWVDIATVNWCKLLRGTTNVYWHSLPIHPQQLMGVFAGGRIVENKTNREKEDEMED